MKRTLWLTVGLALSLAPAQDRRQRPDDTPNPVAGQPAAIAAGAKFFAAACSACHGLHGEGGRGPKLSEARLVRGTNRGMFDVIQNGAKGTDMPPFPLPDEKIWEVVAYVRSLNAPAFETGAPGDPEAGRAVFYGKGGCTECHMIRGQGGFLGPDLTGVGLRRPVARLREAVVTPGARVTEGFQAVSVITRTGQRITGVAKNHTNYSLQVLDAQGGLHLLDREELREVSLRNESPMPADYAQRLSAAEIENLVAFLGRQSERR